jgi:hypothetical protein
MQLRLESRAVGDVMVVQCQGRIVTGSSPKSAGGMVLTPVISKVALSRSDCARH